VPAIQIIDQLQKRFKPDKARNVNATYLISVRGEEGGNWLVKINKGQCEFLPYVEKTNGDSDTPANCSISIDAYDLESIIAGRLSAMTAALSGVLSIDGELGLAMQLIPIFFESGF
jgi:putative sterol carrier protein